MLKKLAGQAALFGISSILGRMLNYLLVPLYTKVFMASEYAVIGKLYAWVAFLNVVYTFGLETTYFRFASKKDLTSADREAHYQQAFSLLGLIAGGLTLAMMLGADGIAAALDYPGKGIFITWLGLTMLVDALAVIPMARLRLEQKGLRFVVIRLSSVVLMLLLNLGYFRLLKPAFEGEFGPDYQAMAAGWYDPAIGVGYAFLANLIANAIMLLLLLPELLKFRLRLVWADIRPMLIYAWPLLVMGLAGMVDEMFSRAILDKVLPQGFYSGIDNASALGVFSACYKLSIFMSLAIQAFRYAADPFFFSNAEDKQAPELFAKVMHAFVIVCTLIFLAVSLNLWWIAPIFLKRAIYLKGLGIVPVLLLANMCLGIYYNLTVWFKLTGKTYYGTYISLGGAVFTLVANLSLIPLYGYMGSAFATLGCYLTMSAACYFIGQRHWPIPYKWGRTIPYVLLAVALVGVQTLAGADWSGPIRLGYQAMSIATFTAYLIWQEPGLLTLVQRLSGRKSA